MRTRGCAHEDAVLAAALAAPRVPLSADLAAHLACWQLFSERALGRGAPPPSFTPEFGPDGYMPTLPFTDRPVADLLTINTAMAQWLRRQFSAIAVDRMD